jgi:enoyl-CoA hydratase/carnithine racemase
MPDASIRVEVSESIATLTIDRPSVKNALDLQTVNEARSALASLAHDAGVGVLIVTGAGETSFVSGADINDIRARGRDEGLAAINSSLFAEIERFPRPTIAAINGYALGGGCELALACDFRVMADNGNIGQPEILLGIIPGAGGTQRLPRLIGPARAKDIIFSGRFLKGYEALNIGLVDAVVPAEKVWETALEMAERYAKGPTVALRAAKIAVNRGLQTDLQNGLLIEREMFVNLFSTQDQKIGMRTFIEKGPGKAEFVGR